MISVNQIYSDGGQLVGYSRIIRVPTDPPAMLHTRPIFTGRIEVCHDETMTQPIGALEFAPHGITLHMHQQPPQPVTYPSRKGMPLSNIPLAFYDNENFSTGHTAHIFATCMASGKSPAQIAYDLSELCSGPLHHKMADIAAEAGELTPHGKHNGSPRR